MAKLIKSFRSEEEKILEYVRNPLEVIGDSGSGRGYVDPATILAEARAEAEQKVQEAYAEGLRRGEEAGLTAFQESIAEAAGLLQEVMTGLQEHRAKFTEEIESEVAELVRAVARKVLATEVMMHPEVVQQMVRRTLEKILDQERVTIRVNPNDLTQVTASKESLLEQFEGIRQLELIPDESIESGGCVAESERFYIDAQLEAQLTQLIDGMTETQD